MPGGAPRRGSGRHLLRPSLAQGLRRVQLQGIAVDLNPRRGHARQKIGSALLAHCTEAARSPGFASTSLGAADDEGVARLYLHNVFLARPLVAKTADHAELARVDVDDYARGKPRQQALRSLPGAREVIFIFAKCIVDR